MKLTEKVKQDLLDVFTDTFQESMEKRKDVFLTTKTAITDIPKKEDNNHGMGGGMGGGMPMGMGM